ncbi:unnamed protein product, partial [marine sediment metagenome]
ARGNIGKSSRLETLCIAAKRCSRRSIPDSRRIHHPSMSCTPTERKALAVHRSVERLPALRTVEPVSEAYFERLWKWIQEEAV